MRENSDDGLEDDNAAGPVDEEQDNPDNKDFQKRFNADIFAGIIPTKVDEQQKSQMMGFISYA